MKRHALLITGAATGIGQACAIHLAQAGHMVFPGVRRREDGDQFREESAGKLFPIVLDITNKDSIKASVDAIQESSGERVFSIINNAGISIRGPIEFLSLSLLREQLEVNLIGQIALTQAFLPLIRRRGGRIVFISSASGRLASPFLGPYSASKAGLEIISSALRMELMKSSIHVSVVVCGSIRTPIWEKATRSAKDIANDLPIQAQEMYSARIEKSNQFYDRIGNEGLPPERVAKTVAHILNTKSPRAHYFVGRDARLYSLISKLTPSSFREWLTLHLMKLMD